MSYDEVKTIRVKTGFGSPGRIIIQKEDASYSYIFPKSQLEAVKAIIKERLALKMVEKS